jgi:hypothetical protein
VFSGDTRITMLYVAPLSKAVPKKQLFPILEKEAPDFLAELLNLELPPTTDRLNIPIVVTSEKLHAEKSNQTLLELFLEERCHCVTGHVIRFAEFYEAFREWVDPSEAAYWTKVRVGRELPPQYVRGRLPQTGSHFIANISWAAFRPGDEVLPKITVKGEFLHGVDYERFRDYVLGKDGNSCLP